MSPPLVLAQTPRLLALVKPAGLPVFPPHADPAGDCLLRRLLEAHPEQGEPPWPPGFEGGLAHRLDNPTSGLLIAARDPDSLAWIRSLFQEKRLLKTYSLISARPVPWRDNQTALELGHDPRRKDRMVVRRGANTPCRGAWIEASTRFQRQETVALGARWQAQMRSGVMHQIRVHAAFLGIALLGDRLYGGGLPLGPESLPGLPEGVPFLLHHHGVRARDLDLPACPLPDWWPRG